jgi:isoquinoline 1-oxidoreductase alpha subunit
MMNDEAFLASNPSPTEGEILEAQQGNICRCITYTRIKVAIKRASEIMQGA